MPKRFVVSALYDTMYGMFICILNLPMLLELLVKVTAFRKRRNQSSYKKRFVPR